MAKQPNILFILSDDHAAHAISAYTDNGFGPRILHTPNLDRIADPKQGGVRADNCFCTNSICTPSRASILTGQHTHVCGVKTLADRLDNTHEPQVQKLLKNAGYRTSIFGKWHLGHGQNAQGVDSDPAGFDDWAVLPHQGLYYDPTFYVGSDKGRRGELHTQGYVTDIITDMASEWLDQWDEDYRQNDEPFFMCVHHKAPHREWEPGPMEKHLFEDQTMAQPQTLWDDYATRPAAASVRMRIDRDLLPKDVKGLPPRELEGRDLKQWYYDRYIKDYLRCCAGIDRNVGRLLDKLQEMGLAENTIVVYTSDQGFFLGDHGFYDKRLIYEHSLRMPLLMRLPNEFKAASHDAMVTNVDLAPTLLELVGLPVHEQMQGSSFAPMLKGDDEPQDWQQSIYYRYWMHGDRAHHVPAHYGVRTRTHKLTYYYCKALGCSGAGQINLDLAPHWELFDLTTDPNELRNIYGESGTETVTAELKTELRRLQDQFADEPVLESM
ncbi:MAG TPA: sulfatase [Phycisphaerales bacterium]|nr:sulfatase [Phycisphaerales bacterium]|tara:strand:- start:796 stop:2277 length:1482 start_codon:yes stop_codon:yes gene_type:complete